MRTWDEFEQQTAFRRPSDWQSRPDGPDEIDLMVADARASGSTISRKDVFLAMGAVERPHRWEYIGDVEPYGDTWRCMRPGCGVDSSRPQELDVEDPCIAPPDD